MRKKSLLAATSAVLLASATFASPAMARNPIDNVHGNTGSVNICAGDTCVEKVGDDARVEWIVQGFPLTHSSNHEETTSGFDLYIPDVVKNLEITAISIPVKTDGYNNQPDYVLQDTELSMPITTSQELRASSLDAYLMGKSETPHVFKHLDPTNSGEKLVDWPDPLGPDTGNAAGWHLYSIGLPPMGVSTFRVTGTVTTQAENTYIPIRATNKTWKCNSEGVGGGSIYQGCQSIREFYWGRTGDLPAFSMSNPDVIDELARLHKPYGADGFTTLGCTATQNYSMDIIGTDYSNSFSAGEKYRQEFRLNDNHDITYIVPLGMEDGCDQAMFHISICPPEEDDPSTEPEEGTKPGNNSVIITDIDRTEIDQDQNIDNSIHDNVVDQDISIIDSITTTTTGDTNNNFTANGNSFNLSLLNGMAPGGTGTTGGNSTNTNTNTNTNNTATTGGSPTGGTGNTSGSSNTGALAAASTGGRGNAIASGGSALPKPSSGGIAQSASSDRKPVMSQLASSSNGNTSLPASASPSRASSGTSTSASPMRGVTLANTGMNSTALAALTAIALLMIAGGVLMTRRRT